MTSSLAMLGFCRIRILHYGLRGLRFKAELDGTNYVTEGFEELPQSSKMNIGLIYPVNKDFS